MREWINLFESTSTVPDLSQFVTSELIDEIINQNKWVHHGAELDDWLDGSMYASDHANELGLSDEEAEALEKMPFEQARHTPEFRRCVEHWVNYRAKDVQDTFVEGNPYDHIEPFGPDTILTRVLRAQTVKSSLGVYWTELSPQSIVRVAPTTSDPILILQTKAKNVTIDWYETLRSRLDYNNGCDEAEIQLIKGSPVTEIRMGTMNYNPTGHNAFFDPKKIMWSNTLTSGTV